jgi:hypothetical protein
MPAAHNISLVKCSTDGPELLGLERYDAMCTAIADCYGVDEAKGIRDKARALEVYAQQAMNTAAERRACEIRMRAERRAGELLMEMKGLEVIKEGRPEKRSSGSTVVSEPRKRLSDLGVSKTQSSQWQRLAEIPHEEFEQAITAPGPKPSTEGLLNSRIVAEMPQKRIDPDALNAWGRIKDFERGGLLGRKPSELLEEMTEPMREDVLRLAPDLIRWLGKFKG